MSGRDDARAGEPARAAPRWRRGPRSCFWLVAFAAPLLAAAGKHLLLNEIAILALFALSLDLILGYAGIVSLGHAAFFGLGAYARGAVRQARDARSAGRASRVAIARRGACSASSTSFAGPARHRPDAADGDARRRADPATSSPTSSTGSPAAPTACRASSMAPLLGRFEFDLVRPHRLRLQPGRRCSSLFLLARRHRALAVRPVAAGDPRQPRCAPRPSACRCIARLVAVYTLAAGYRRRRRRAARADHAASPRSTCSTSTARPTCCWCW